jgi:AraC family transcriptional regulator
MSDPGTRWEYGTNMDFVGKAVETASGSKRKMVSEELENMRGPDGLQMAQQQDGGLPTTVVAGSAPGESGVAVFRVRAQRGLSFNAVPESHLIWFQTSSQVSFECRMAGQAISHMPPEGTLAITPAGSDCSGDAVGNTELILVAIDLGQLALAAAEDSTPGAQLDGRLSGYDRVLFDLARTLALESAGEYSNGAAIVE